MDRLRREVTESWDLFFLLVVFWYLSRVASDLRGESGTFAYVFLLMGMVAVTIQIVINFLPGGYSEKIQALTEGASGAFDDEIEATDAQDEQVPPSKARLNIGVLVLLIAGYGFLSYFITVLYATPVFVVATVFAVGDRDVTKAIVLSVILSLIVFYLFGEVMNVPIDEGVLLG